MKKGKQAAEEILHEVPKATIVVMKLDLSSLKSVQTFSENYKKKYSKLNCLINNAGVMACPFSKTKDGFEIQMGVNHLGHFALTGHLMPLLKKTKNSRIVSTSSMAHKSGDINFDDINWKKRDYATMKAYCDSKIANLYFTYELVRKLKNDSTAPLITAAHPGWTGTDLQRTSRIFRALNPLFSQKVEYGVLPTLRAAFGKNVKSGDYFGPSGFMEIKGYPVVVKSNELSHNKANAKKLWVLSERMSGVRY